MTTRATDGHTEKDASDSSRRFSQIILPNVSRNQVRSIPRRQSQKSSRDETLRIRLIIVPRFAVFVTAANLKQHKPVVWHVVVERIDYPVPVAPGISDRSVALKSAGLPISRQVEPVPPPTLPVSRIG